MRLDRLWLVDFRNYATAEVTLTAGLAVIVGDNGAGKTNLLEAIGFLATLSSFRGVGNDALVRAGAPQAVVRGEGERAGRALLIEAEIRPAGRGRVTINRQPLRRSSDLSSALQVSVFSPDDLELVKAGPTGRRRYLDDTLASVHPRNDAARRDLERVVRQRNALLSQAASLHGKLTDEIATTLEVWDARLVETGGAVGAARAELVARLAPAVAKAYAQVAGDGARVSDDHGAMAAVAGLRGPNAVAGLRGPNAVAGLAYDAPWREKGLAAALRAARQDELRRGVTLVGPHRDELTLTIGGMPARTHASQGEQRSLALALRLAAHDVVTELVGEPPLLLLDDVFSELDPARAEALLEHLPPGQAVLTTTGAIPARAHAERVLRVDGGRILMIWKPLRSESPPRGLGPSLDRISRSLGAPSAGALATIFERWETIVGPAVAAHAQPLSLVRGTLTVGVDQPGWATQLTYLGADLRRRIDEVAGSGAVQRVRVTVRPK